LILLGIAVCAWFLFYTDLFPQVVGLLGLGGLFAWIAFLSNLLTEERKKELQARFEQYVLRPPATLMVVFVLAAIFFLGWAPLRGALLVSTTRDDQDRTIEIRRQGSDGRWSEVVVEEEHLSPRSEHTYSLPTCWFHRREYQVKVSGLPARKVTVSAWRRRPLSVPVEFDVRRQPILLVHLSAEANSMVQVPEPPGRLQLLDNGKLVEELFPYRGENVWVGGEEDIAVPEWIATRWLLVLSRDGMPPEHLARWRPARSLAATSELRAGQRFELHFIPPSGVVLRQSVTVGPPYPQEVSIDVQP
jgi:hypothetical protein